MRSILSKPIFQRMTGGGYLVVDRESGQQLGTVRQVGGPSPRAMESRPSSSERTPGCQPAPVRADGHITRPTHRMRARMHVRGGMNERDRTFA